MTPELAQHVGNTIDLLARLDKALTWPCSVCGMRGAALSEMCTHCWTMDDTQGGTYLLSRVFALLQATDTAEAERLWMAIPEGCRSCV